MENNIDDNIDDNIYDNNINGDDNIMVGNANLTTETYTVIRNLLNDLFDDNNEFFQNLDL